MTCRKCERWFEIHEYYGSGLGRTARYSSFGTAYDVAIEECDHNHEVCIIEMVYCRPLSKKQVFPVEKTVDVYCQESIFA